MATTETTKTEALRDDEGRYAVSLERLCVCGHAKGEHAAGPKGRSIGDCLAGTFRDADGNFGPGCSCEKFRPSKKRS